MMMFTVDGGGGDGDLLVVAVNSWSCWCRCVKSYSSWLKALRTGDNICPITKKPLQKRQLVVLTHENIETYRDRIVQM